MVIDSRTELLGVWGHPIGHTLSPLIHNHCFRQRGLNAVYLAFSVSPGELGKAVEASRSLFRGYNVTVPHKERIICLLDEVDATAAAAGAVNVVSVDNGRLAGHNTDIDGFVWSLKEDGGVDPNGIRAVVLGSGGAARAVVVGLLAGGAGSITVVARNTAKAEELASRTGDRRVGVGSMEDLTAILGGADLLVNCTPVGMHPDAGKTPCSDLDRLPPGAVVYDLIYNPAPTALLQEAGRLGLKAIDGRGMLARQAALAWRYWFNETGPDGTMLALLKEALG